MSSSLKQLDHFSPDFTWGLFFEGVLSFFFFKYKQDGPNAHIRKKKNKRKNLRISAPRKRLRLDLGIMHRGLKVLKFIQMVILG